MDNPSRENNNFDMYVPNVGTLNVIKQTLLDFKAQIDPNTTIVWDFNTPLLPVARSARPLQEKKSTKKNQNWVRIN
jgi:hypothetical protein